MGPLVYRPTAARALCVVTWVLLAGTLATTAWRNPVAGLRWLPVLGLVAAVVFALFWRPSVEVDDDAVTMRNVVRDIRVPWARLDAVDTRYALSLHAQGRRYAAWAAPAPGRSQALRQSRRDAEALSALGTNLEHGLRASATPNSDSGGASLLVRTRWEQALSGSAARSGDGPAVTVTIAGAPVAALAATTLGTVVAVLLA
jgi:hypothetical protein